MQLIKHAEYRTVDYFGEELEIPAHHCYVATNEDGFVFSFMTVRNAKMVNGYIMTPMTFTALSILRYSTCKI